MLLPYQNSLRIVFLRATVPQDCCEFSFKRRTLPVVCPPAVLIDADKRPWPASNL
jgi:hypothetical protein